MASLNSTSGSLPYDTLTLGQDGDLYGSASFEGTGYNYGAIFKMDTLGNLTTVYAFTSSSGGGPDGPVIQGADGNFYGTTSIAGTHYFGTVFKLTPTGSLTTLVAFDGLTQGGTPYAGLVQGSDGNFYGTTQESLNTSNAGSLFRVTPTGSLTPLFYFNNTSGANPVAPLLQASDGNFYGTTEVGGTYNNGSVFKMSPSGSMTLLTSFTGTGPNGSDPMAPLIQGTDGNFYGTTYAGGSQNDGTAFKLSPSGSLATLVNFQYSIGIGPRTALTLGSDGNFYGTTSGPGPGSFGSVFKMSSTGSLTTFLSFGGTSGSTSSALIQAKDGNFYGTTSYTSQSSTYVSVFRLSLTGSLTTLALFTGSNGENPEAGLIQGSDGNFYGTTGNGGANSEGTAFVVTPTGTLTTLASFNSSNGSSPNGLLQGADGNFYGTTAGGGSNGDGTVFTLTPTGSLTTLVSFNVTNGATPDAALIQGSDGNFYGTTLYGGSCNAGTVFVLSVANTSTLTFSSPSSGTVSGTSFSISGTTLDLTLDYVPSPGDVLTVLNNTGAAPISGTYSNLPDGGTISASYNGTSYNFVASYEGGPSGDSLTLTYSTTPNVAVDTPTLPAWMLGIFGLALLGLSAKALRERTVA